MSNIKLSRVTFTGADDSVRGVELREFTQRCNLPSFIEWGMLVSPRQEGRHRFPSFDRLDEFLFALSGAKCFLSMHVCGAWVREICDGNWDGLIEHYGWKKLSLFDRVQLNFHADAHALEASRFFTAAKRVQKRLGFDLILQLDGVNDHLMLECHRNGITAFPLFDLSGGKGELPESWNTAFPRIYNGYAGGLGPDNIEQELPKITAAAGEADYWIDMETRVRSHGDTQFDLGACRRVMEGIDRYLKTQMPAFVH